MVRATFTITQTDTSIHGFPDTCWPLVQVRKSDTTWTVTLEASCCSRAEEMIDTIAHLEWVASISELAIEEIQAVRKLV